MKTSIAMLLFALVVLTAEVSGQTRKKFVLGIGTGGGMSFISYSGEFLNVDTWDYEKQQDNFVYPCLSTSFRIGYAPSENFFICWNSRANWFKRPEVNSYDEENVALMGGGAGLGITFFPVKNAPNLFFNGLFGYSNLGDAFKQTGNNFGTQLTFGAGYEIIRHFTAELNFQFSTSQKYYFSGDFKNPLIINLTINYLTF
jgi:hypothetical protein